MKLDKTTRKGTKACALHNIMTARSSEKLMSFLLADVSITPIRTEIA